VGTTGTGRSGVLDQEGKTTMTSIDTWKQHKNQERKAWEEKAKQTAAGRSAIVNQQKNKERGRETSRFARKHQNEE